MPKKHGPWIIKKSKIIYQDNWLKLTQDQVIKPDKTSGTFSLVKMKDGVSVLPFDNEGYVYLVKEFRYGLGENNIGTISGAIEPKETPLQAAKRELKEETGIIAKKWIHLGKIDPFSNSIKSSADLFLAQNLNFTNAHPEGTEKIKIIKVKFGEAVKMSMSNKITHAQSCVLILKTAYLIASNLK